MRTMAMAAELHLLNEDTEELLTVDEALRKLKISRATLYRYADQHLVDLIFLGPRRRRVTLASVNRYLNEQLRASRGG